MLSDIGKHKPMIGDKGSFSHFQTPKILFLDKLQKWCYTFPQKVIIIANSLYCLIIR